MSVDIDFVMVTETNIIFLSTRNRSIRHEVMLLDLCVSLKWLTVAVRGFGLQIRWFYEEKLRCLY